MTGAVRFCRVDTLRFRKPREIDVRFSCSHLVYKTIPVCQYHFKRCNCESCCLLGHEANRQGGALFVCLSILKELRHTFLKLAQQQVACHRWAP